MNSADKLSTEIMMMFLGLLLKGVTLVAGSSLKSTLRVSPNDVRLTPMATSAVLACGWGMVR